MTHFEYIAAAHTLVLTFAAARILASVSNALNPRRLYWVHLSWVSLAIMFCLTSFWLFWGYREVEWTLPRLVSLLATPALIYVFSSMLVPADSSDVESWREYFFGKRLPLFGVGVLMTLAILFSNQTLGGVSALHFSQIPMYLLLGTFAAGAASGRPLLHSVLALAPPLLIAALLLSRMAEPNWNAP